MATSTFRDKNKVRPKKPGYTRRKRIRAHKLRLMDMGVPEETLLHMTPKDMRTLLKRPNEVRKQYGAAE